MRGFIIMISIFSIMLLLVLAEELYVADISKDLYDDISRLEQKSPAESGELVDDISACWKKQYKKLVYFINQKELDNITLELETAKSFYQSGNLDLYKAYLQRAKERIKNIPDY